MTSPGPTIPGRRHHAWLAEARELLRLALPMAATQLGQMVILATDAAMLGHYSKDALAASALGNAVFFFIWLLGSGPVQAVSPMIAHIKGGHADSKKPYDRRAVRGVARMGLWSVLLMSPVLLGVLFFTRSLLLLAHQDAALSGDAATYVAALAFGVPFSLAFQVLRNFATALSRPMAPMIVMGLAIAMNVLGDYALIFGHFGAPALGLIGAGVASALSNLFSFCVLLTIVLTAPGLRDYRILRRLGQPVWAHMRELFRLGIPMSVTTIFEFGLFNAATLVMGTFGTATLAAHQIAITVPSLTFMVPLGIGLAATVRVGLATGAGDAKAARRAGFTAMGVGAVFMITMAALILLFPRAIATLWLPDIPANALVLAQTLLFLKIAAAFQLVDGQQVTASMSLRGLKDAQMPMWLAGASYWLAGAPMCVALGFGLGMKGLGIWLGLAFGLAVAAVLLTARFALLSKRAIAVRQ